MENFDSSTYLLIAVVVLGISLGVMYLIINAAVKSALGDLLKSSKRLVMLKELELKKQGFTETEIKEAILSKEMNILRHELKNNYISQAVYDYRVRELEKTL